MSLKFRLDKVSGQARSGFIQTLHGEIETPVFMPVGTRASVKSLSQEDLESLGAQVILGNTYHLYLRPGHTLIEEVAGDLHRFMSWKKPILTDSGGFQVYSLSTLSKMTEEGVHFQSHIDGSRHFFTPEKSMEVQKALGSDIVMCLDECPALPASEERLRTSMELTLRWAKRCRQFALKDHQALFGIIQGGLNLELRRECLQRLEEMQFEGLALGGLSVGEKNEEMVQLCQQFVPEMPVHKPRYLMGVGKPLDVLNGVRSGIDMFDCVLPTRNARNGQVFTRQGPLNIKNQRFLKDTLPLDPQCTCRVCQRYTRSYLRHLFLVEESLVASLISYHNLWFYMRMMEEARVNIRLGQFENFYQKFFAEYKSDLWRGGLSSDAS